MDITNAKLAIASVTPTQYTTSGNNGMLVVDSVDKSLVTKTAGTLYKYPTSGVVASMISSRLPNQNLNTSASVYFASITSPTISALQEQLAEASLGNAVLQNPSTAQIISGAGLGFENTTVSIYTSAIRHFTDGKIEWINTSADLYSPSNNILKTNDNFQALSVSAQSISAATITVGNIDNTEFNYLNGTSANIQTQLTNLSATKADKTTTITAGAGLTGGGNLSSNRTISLATTGTAGTYDKVVTNAYGQVTSGRNLISSDLPSGIDASKIADGSVSNTEFQYLNTVSANIQTQLNNIRTTSDNAVVTNPTATQRILGYALEVQRDGSGLGGLQVRRPGDTAMRGVFYTDGNLGFGSGSAAIDTNLYRNGVNGLKTDDVFEAEYGLRSTNYDAPIHNNLRGVGIEVHYTQEVGRILSYDRTNSTYIPTRLDGSNLQFYVSGTSIGTVSNNGVTFTNVSATGNFVNTAYTGDRVLVSNASKQIVESTTIDSTELGYLNGVSANIQTQLTNLSATKADIQTQINSISPSRIANSAEYFDTNSTNKMYSSATFSDILSQGSFGRFDVKSRIFFYDNPGQTSATIVCDGTSASFGIPLTATQSFIDLDFSVVNHPTNGNTITPIRCVTSVGNQCMQPNIFMPWRSDTTKPIYFWIRTTNTTRMSFYTTQINAA